MRSRMEMIPAISPPSRTGRCRKPPWIMSAAAWSVPSAASIVSGWRVIQSRTSASSLYPAATERRTSRSVRMPASRPPSRTSTAPTPRSAICFAASPRRSSGATVSRSRDMWFATTGTAGRTLKLGRELLHPSGDFVANAPDVSRPPPGGNGQVPVDVALARDVRALVAAAHGHDDVGPLGVGRLEATRDAPADVDADLGERRHDLRMDALGRARPGRASLVVPVGGPREEGL